MTAPASPLATPLAWDLVAPGYAAFNVTDFERYAADALSWAELSAEDHVLDVATGPGSLALLAAPTVSRVDAIDFSAEMLSAFRARLQRTPAPNVFLAQGDGQALPYADASFDAAFSMFGLIFFPDRGRGFAELRRVLVPGGRAVVSSWQPLSQVPLLMNVLEFLNAELPDLPFGDGKGPLTDPNDLQQEMSAAGFEVEVREVVHTSKSPSFAAFWAEFPQSFVPFTLLRHKLGDAAFAPILANIEQRLLSTMGPGPVEMTMPAWLGLARCC